MNLLETTNPSRADPPIKRFVGAVKVYLMEITFISSIIGSLFFKFNLRLKRYNHCVCRSHQRVFHGVRNLSKKTFVLQLCLFSEQDFEFSRGKKYTL